MSWVGGVTAVIWHLLHFAWEQAAFADTRAGLLGRPWAVDDLDVVLDCWAAKQYHKALIFVDNAGSDVVLGGPHDPIIAACMRPGLTSTACQ